MFKMRITVRKWYYSRRFSCQSDQIRPPAVSKVIPAPNIVMYAESYERLAGSLTFQTCNNRLREENQVLVFLLRLENVLVIWIFRLPFFFSNPIVFGSKLISRFAASVLGRTYLLPPNRVCGFFVLCSVWPTQSAHSRAKIAPTASCEG